ALGLVRATVGLRRGGVSGAAAGWLVAAGVQAVLILPTVVRAAVVAEPAKPAGRRQAGPPVRGLSAPGGEAGVVRPLRVAMVTPRYHPVTGGVETHVHEVATRLAARGVEVTVLTADSSGRLPACERLDGVLVRRRRAWPWL